MNNNTPDILTATRRNDLKQINRLLTENPACIHETDYEKRTPLHVAVEHHHIAAARLLINAGANPNATDNNGNTPLSHVGLPRGKELLKLLINAGANGNIRKATGNMMHIAASVGEWGVIELLVQGGGNVNPPNAFGQTPLTLALSNEYYMTALTLCYYGAKHDAKHCCSTKYDTNDTGVAYPETELLHKAFKYQREKLNEKLAKIKLVENQCLTSDTPQQPEDFLVIAIMLGEFHTKIARKLLNGTQEQRDLLSAIIASFSKPMREREAAAFESYLQQLRPDRPFTARVKQDRSSQEHERG